MIITKVSKCSLKSGLRFSSLYKVGDQSITGYVICNFLQVATLILYVVGTCLHQIRGEDSCEPCAKKLNQL